MSSKNSKSSAKPKKLKSKRGYGKNVTKTKVVVRRLPPLIPESLFFESVKQWVNEETCTWSRFHQGRISKSKNKESIFSRAYFHFKTVEQVLEFHRGYDNHLFIDKQGNENRAVVEFAVYQKLPKEHKKPDPRQGTIETDPDYLAFLESLKMEEIQQATAKEPGVVLESGATQLERLEARLANAVINAASVVEKPTTTPLLEHLRALKLGPKSKPPPLKHAQVAILSSSGLSTKGTGSRAAKQSSQQTRANEFPQSTNRPKRELVDEKLKEKTKEQVKEKENYRRRDKKQERQKLMREREKKAQATEANKSELPTITIVPRPQTEEAPVKITIQQRQKEQIRQFIQKTSPSPKKEINTAENDSKETAYQESFAKDSTGTVQKDTRKEESKDTSEAPVTSSSSNVPSNENHYRRRDRSRKHSTDTKTPVQIQILTKPQTQSTNTSESNVSTSTSSAAVSSSGSAATTNTPSPIRRRGYYGKRGGRW
ncbi:4465_t:CDS:2 [Rhizophagus irregularis]|nr:4465_t:CDS:2 [Rhizophagus irregularis]